MIKWVLGITIAVVFAVSMMIFLPPAYAPHASAVPFSFVGSTTDVLPNIIMTGHGAWKVGGKIGAGGTFTDLPTGVTGTWRAITLTDVSVVPTCSPCDLITSTGGTPSIHVVFTAKFNPRGSAPSFQADVIVATSDITTAIGGKNFWVEGFGFGTTSSTFR